MLSPIIMTVVKYTNNGGGKKFKPFVIFGSPAPHVS